MVYGGCGSEWLDLVDDVDVIWLDEVGWYPWLSNVKHHA